jgi:hypothetical protein
MLVIILVMLIGTIRYKIAAQLSYSFSSNQVNATLLKRDIVFTE